MPVYDAGAASGRMLALDLDPARGDVDRQAAELGQLLERLGARYVADVAPSGGQHVYVLFAAALPWRELRDVCQSAGAALPGDRHGADGWPRRPDLPAGLQAQERRLAGALDAAGRSRGGRRAPERAGGMGRAADRVRGRAAAA